MRAPRPFYRRLLFLSLHLAVRFVSPFGCVLSHTSQCARTLLRLCVVTGKALSELGHTLFLPPLHPPHSTTAHLVDGPFLSPTICILSPPQG